jgi:transcriptional regulator with PAS, ATPase and Fis domain
LGRFILKGVLHQIMVQEGQLHDFRAKRKVGYSSPDRIKKSADLLREVLDNLQHPVFIMDERDRVLYSNNRLKSCLNNTEAYPNCSNPAITGKQMWAAINCWNATISY